MLSPMPCSVAGSILCEDFENGMNPAYRPSIGGGSMIVVDETRARGGKKALHALAQAAGGAGTSISIGNPVFPAADNSFFMRAFVYYASPAGSDNVYLFNVSGSLPGSIAGTIDAAAATPMRAYAAYGVEGYPFGAPTAPGFRVLASLIYHSDIPTADHKAYRNPAGAKVPFDRWVCWELQVDGVKGEWRSWLDGAEQFTMRWNKNPTAPWLVPQVSRMSVGISHPHDEPGPIEVWFDDLVIGTERVGCGP